ncbi:MAG: DDE-type integrase/transposase/recombinase [Rhodopila sp.]|nr:DDE-type integrase/transposase/recombinase [Rhodopila sp.]
MIGVVVSVNAGLPQDVAWQGRTVPTGDLEEACDGADFRRQAESGSVANLADRSAWCSFTGNSFGGEHVMIAFKGSHFERDVILWAVRGYVAYPISYRQLAEMMEEHGVEVDHATLNRWVLKHFPPSDQEFRARKRLVGLSWRMDETYVRVKGAGKYLYRAVDKAATVAAAALKTNSDLGFPLSLGWRPCYDSALFASKRRRRPMTEPMPRRPSGPSFVKTRSNSIQKAIVNASVGRSDKLR